MATQLDRFTPCAPRPMEQHVRRKLNNTGLTSQKDMIQQLSVSISSHEDRFATLTRNLDINLDSHDNSVCTSEASDPSFRLPHVTPAQHSGKQQTKDVPEPYPRPGRLSPSVMQMLFSPKNVSGFSEGSSGADTSYDSGLYRWLGVGDLPASESSPRPLRVPKDLSETNKSNPNTSPDSSLSVYSQPSFRTSSTSRIILPLSPPATVRPPFVESLEPAERETEDDPPFRATSRPLASNFVSRGLSDEDVSEVAPEYSEIFHDFAAPLIFLKNISLQHYLPSAAVLRHFQRVIDELRGKYVPNDQANNAPTRWTRRPSSRESGLLPPQISHDMSSSLMAPHYKAFQDLDVVRIAADSPRRPVSKTTRELYTELAGILFEQVAQDEVQVDKLKRLAERIEILAQKKRTAALVICMRGRGNITTYV